MAEPSTSRHLRDVLVLAISMLVLSLLAIALAYLGGLVGHFVYDAALAGWNAR